jgi:aromatic-L-amino-acid decarboxylase
MTLADREQSTASDSALVAVVAARSRYQVEHPNCKAEELVIYTTTQTHSLGTKAGLVLGLQVHALEVRAEDRYSLRGEALRSALVEDEKLGRKPFILSTLCRAIALLISHSSSRNRRDYVIRSN